MKNTIVLLITLACLVGCKDKPAPKEEVRVESASEAMRNDDRAIAERLAEQKGAADKNYQQQRAADERKQLAESLTAVGRKVSDVIEEASRTGRSSLAPVLTKMADVKKEVDAVAVNDCTGGARASLAAALATAIDVYTQFSKESGAASDAAQQRLVQVATQFADYEKALGACR